ncbi:MAG: phosphoglucosamine mutase [Nocardioidaceae bacterium]|nr:phosphoglucosamine mutase [Nocardioidaceae bacterium]
MPRHFGTDGVRGVANVDLTAELALDLSVAAAHVLGETGAFDGAARTTGRLVAVVGRDGRASGEFLEAAVVAGLASAGVDVLTVGVLPTPGIAYLTGETGADLGVVLSASHNPMPDNGLKFLASGGVKLDDATEAAVEQRLREPWQRPTGADVGRVRALPRARDRYVDHLAGSLPDDADPARLGRLRVVVDCANGAAFEVAPQALSRLGIEVVPIHATPDGLNINDNCGSTHLGDLQTAVRDTGADLGFAHDGDADRCLAVDERGDVVDGDHLLAILAIALRDQHRLHEDTVVATVMSNLGFMQAMTREHISVEQTPVGDRYVLAAMNRGSWTLGGEQSGHVIMRDHATTGDGVLTAVQVLARMAQTGASLTELATAMTALPQVLVNVQGVDKARAGHDPDVTAAVEAAAAELGADGRVLLRPSGTEPLVRVMVEAPTAEQAHAVAGRLADVVRHRLTLR